MTKTLFYGIMVQYQRWCSFLGGIGLRAGNAKRKTGLTDPPLNPVLVYLRVNNKISINKTINSVVVIIITTFTLNSSLQCNKKIILVWYSPVFRFALGASPERNILPYNNVATWRGLCHPFSIEKKKHYSFSFSALLSYILFIIWCINYVI